jgi:hypothetical protein
VPALRAVRRGFPGHEVVLAAPPALQPLLDLSRAAHRLLPTVGLEPLHWSQPSPAVAVNLHGRGPQSHRLLQSLSPGSLAAFRSSAADHPGPVWAADEHEVRRWCRLVEESLDLPADPADLLLDRPAPDPPDEGTVVVHPGAAYPARRWPPDRFAEVARWAAAQGYRVVLTGDGTERRLAEEVAGRAGLPPSSITAGTTGLAQLAATVARAGLVVCGDTGVGHLATAFGTPSVLLFGPTSPARWGPPPSDRHVVLWHGDGTGDPWGDRVDPALLRVTVEEVTAAAQELTARRGAPRPRTTPASA